MTSTPVLHEGRLYLQLIHGEGKASTQEAVVLALNADTGEQVWKHERVTGASDENEHSYASPILYDDGKLKYLISHGADYVIAHELSDGREIWRRGLNPQDDAKLEYHRTLRFVASPVAVEGLIVVPTAKNRPLYAIRPNFKGDITHNPEANVWTLPKTPDVPSPLIHDGLVYLCLENGNLHCLDAATGEQLYATRTHADRHRASPVYADGKLYTTARDGTVTVTKTGKTFEMLAQNKIDETVTGSPAIADGTIYLRSWDALWAIRAK
jgi:outer membrane protein assembly factor BamB